MTAKGEREDGERGRGRVASVRRATTTDAASVAGIYAGYVRDTIVTFETEVVSPEAMAERIRERLAGHDWLVATSDGRVVGYAYYGPFRPRAAYAHTVEAAIYVAPDALGGGVGRTLCLALVESARSRGFREMLGVVALPNPRSVRLLESLGFRRVGLLREVGRKLGSYVDVGLWQISLA